MKTAHFTAKVSRLFYFISIPLILILLFILTANIVRALDYPNSDFFSFWLSGRLVSLGEDPYNEQIWIEGHHQFDATWISDPTFLYPLPLALLFAPLGLLPLYDAFVVWGVLTELMILLSVALLLRSAPGSLHRYVLLPLSLGIILFRPAALTIVGGQLSGLLLLVISAIIFFWEQKKWTQGAALLAVLALKPNLGVPIIGLLSIYLVVRKQLPALAAVALSGAALAAAGLIHDPHWVIEFLQIGNAKVSQTFGYSPTVWGLSALACRRDLPCTIGYGAVIGLLFLLGCWRLVLLRRDVWSPSLVVSFATIITLLLTPYTWPYDQLLLIVPITTLMMRLSNEGFRPFLLAALFFVSLDLFALALSVVGAQVHLEIWNVFIPLSVFCLLAWYLLKSSPGARSTAPA